MKGHRGVKFERVVINRHGDIADKHRVIKRSIYDVDMQRWLHYFSLDHFHFVSEEKLAADPVEELQKIEDFLGIRHKLTKDVFYFDKTKGFYCMCVNQFKLDAKPNRQVKTDRTCLGQSKGRAHPSVDPHVLNKLRKYFRPHNERLYNMIGINFDWK